MATLAELWRRRNRLLSRAVQAETAQSLGATAGKLDARTQNRRTSTLRQLINAGKLDPTQLGPRDKQMVGPTWLRQLGDIPKPGEDESPEFFGIGGDIGAGVSNFFTGAAEFAKNLPGGIYLTGKSIGSDILGGQGLLENPGANPFDLKSQFPSTTKNIVDPTVQYYREKYSGSPGEILNKALVQDPFGTVLDVGTAATLGAGAAPRAGALVSKAGQTVDLAGTAGSRLAKVGAGTKQVGDYLQGFGYSGTRGTRPDLVPGKNAAPIPREYGVSPVVRAGQRFTDKYLDKTPVVGKTLSDWRTRLAQRGLINNVTGRSRLLGSFMAANEAKDFIRATRKMPEKEAIALSWLKNGVSSQPVRPKGEGWLSGIDAMKEVLDASASGKLPEGFNRQNFTKLGVDENYLAAVRSTLDDPEVLQYMNEPTPQMIKASDTWDDQVERNLQTHPIDPDEHQRRIYGPQQALRVKPDELSDFDNVAAIEAIKDPSGSFERFSARYAEETGQPFPIRPNYIPHEIAEGTFAGKVTQVKRSKPIERIRLAEDVTPKPPTYLSPNEMQAFLSGAVRMGTEPLLSHIAKREKYLAQGGMISQLIDKLAEKDPGTGEVVKVTDESAMKGLGYSPETHTALDIEGTFKFFQNENDVLKNVAGVMDEVKKDAPSEVINRADDIAQGLQEFYELSGRKTSQEMMGVSNAPKVVMPREAAKHIQRSLDVMSPSPTGLGRFYDRFIMGPWRSAVLTVMPRWWLNTVAGSTFLTVISGSAKPKYIRAAWRYRGKGDNAAKLTKAAPELGSGSIYGAELYEQTSLGRTRRSPTKPLLEKMMSMENFFKRAGFFHEMDKRAKAHMKQLDEVIDGYTKMPYMKDEYIHNILDNHPELIDHIMNETNRFYYSFTSLGPFERRHVRRFIPFYGWYKFVTKLVYQLPFQYPGRTLIMDKLSNIAEDFEDDELGLLPFDMKGAIFLNSNRSDTEYIPTFGLNPLADFANPAAPEGTLAGLMSSQQLGPVIQAFLQAQGIDPFRGQPNELSPMSDMLTGRFGRIIDPDTGEEVPGGLSSAFSLERLAASGLRSMPQYRTLETLLAGGRYVYPESFPWDEKPLPMEAGAAYGDQGTAKGYLLQNFLGGLGSAFNPKHENLRDYQKNLEEDVKYGEGTKKSGMKRLRKAGVR